MTTDGRRSERSGANGGRSGLLPAEVTNFVGRRHEVAQVKRLLSGARLVTLTGVGGAGKTRLALRVAAESRRLFRDGVWLVDLAPLQDGSLFAYALAETLGLRDQTDRPVAEVIADHVRDRELLIVLDNCEHLLDACAEFAAQALRIAPDLRIMCTSRQPLGTVGEHLWAVPPMPLPDPRRPPGPGDPSYAALVLFADRASVVTPGFALRTDNIALVAEICRRLDGLPLAIELAAAQLRMMSLGQLASALHDRFSVLATRYAVPAHHRTLAATFDWSFELCSPAEQRLWRRMSVFADGFDLPAAEYVCAGDRASAGDAGSQPASSTLEAITGLVDKSCSAGRTLAAGCATGCWRLSGSTVWSGCAPPTGKRPCCDAGIGTGIGAWPSGSPPSGSVPSSSRGPPACVPSIRICGPP